VATAVRNGARIEYEATGNGPPLVLLHGFIGDRSTWHAAGYVSALADQFRLIIIDLMPLIRSTGSRMSRAEVAVLPGCGHFDTFTRTDLTMPLAREFLGRPRP
jgi:pimeloyl-ACP methyl ester carboxylesterase